MTRQTIHVTASTKMLAKAIREIQKEAEAATLEALSARDGIVVLQDIDRRTAKIRGYAGDGVLWFDAHGYNLTMTRDRFRHRGDDWEQSNWRPGQWAVYENRRDGQGRDWDCKLGIFVIDDFGTLVPVEGGAA